MAHMNNKIYIPSRCHKDWKPLLAQPNKHWKKGKSAMELAICWQYSKDFPESVIKTFRNSSTPCFNKDIDIEMLFAFPEYEVPLHGSDKSPSHNDIYVIAKADGKLISIMVEGKVDEIFDEVVSKWIEDKKDKSGKPKRLEFLLKNLGLKEEQVQNIPYQLLHRTYSAIYGAKMILAKDALMLVHSFSEKDSHFEDFKQFVQLFELSAQKDLIVGPKELNGIDLYFGWVKDDSHYSEKWYPCEME